MGVSGTGLSGSATYNGSGTSTFTVTSNATSANTASALVSRDASGNFSAGTITAALSGNATTASALQTARTISLSGDVVGSVSFDGSGNAAIATTIQADSVALGTDTTGNYMVNVAAGTGVSVSHTQGEGSTATVSIGQPVGTTDNVTFNNVTVNGTLTSDDITSANISVSGNATITGNLTVSGTTTTVNSTTVSIADANIELARNATTAAQANGAGITVTGPTTAATFTYSSADDRWNLNKNLNVTTVYGALSGNATTASAWQTARTLSFTGDATGSMSVDGSANASAALTLANSGVSAGTYSSVTVDAKGRVTAGTNPGYLTAESDTLATVTGRGASTSTALTLGGTITVNAPVVIGTPSGTYVTPSSLHIGSKNTGSAVSQLSFESVGAYTGAIAMNSSGNFSWGGQGSTNWYWKINNTYNGDYSSTGSTVASLTSAGSFSTISDVRAPIFYDSNNTAYYLDPTSTSQVSGSRFYFGSHGSIYDDGNIHIDGHNSPVWINSLNSSTIELNTQTSGYVNIGNSARAPIFYDSANTAYYLDPAASTSLNVNGYILSQGTGGDKGAILGNIQVGYAAYYNTLQTPTNADTIWMQYAHSGNIGLAYGGGSVIVGPKTTPASRLHVYSSGLSDNSTNVLLTLDGKFTAAGVDSNDIIGIAFRVENSAGGSQTTTSIASSYQSSANALLLQHQGGNVGIGTINPALTSGYTGLNVVNSGYTQLRVQSTASSAGLEFKPSTGNSWEFQGTNSNTFILYDRSQGVYRWTVSSSGNMNIGWNNDTDQGYKLAVNGTGYFASIVRTNAERLVLRDDSIEVHATDNDSAGVAVNYLGYAGGTTRFRDFNVYDGKGGLRFKTYGSSNYAYAPASFRAPIFYDSDDAGYYIDANSVSNLWALKLNRNTDHQLQVARIRGLNTDLTGDYIHMYERVHIGYPSGWGGIDAPSYGLSTWGQIHWNRSMGASNWGYGVLSMDSGWGGTGNYPTIGSGGSSGSLIMLHNVHLPFRTDNARSGASGRAGIRLAIDAAASSWWDVGLTGDAFEIYRSASGTQQLWINSGGDVYARASMLAPIFYERDNTNYYADPAGTSRFAKIVQDERYDATNIATYGGVYSGDWQNLTNTTGQFNVVQVANIASGHSNHPGSVYTYGGVLSWKLSNHSFQLYAAHTGDLAFKTQWNNDNYSGWRYPMIYNQINGTGGNVYGTTFIDQDDTNYYVNPASTSRLSQISIGGNANYININYDQMWRPDGGTIYLQYYTAGNIDLNSGGGYTVSNTSIRAPIFYDSNDTAYRADPASTSIFNKLILNDNYVQATYDDVKRYAGLSAASAQAVRHTVGRIYFCPNHWGDWSVVNIKLQETSYSQGSVEYNIWGWYGMGNGSSLNIDAVRTNGWSRGDYRVVLGSVTSAGWQYAGHNTYYQDVYVDVDYYAVVEVLVGVEQSAITNSNPASGTGWAYVFYNSPATTNISSFDETIQLTDRYSRLNTVDFRAPTFYDSNNTAYWTDPNGQSSLWGVAIRGDYGGTSTDNQLFLWGAGNSTTSAIGFKQVGSVWAEHGRTNGGYNTYFTMDSPGRGWVFRNGTGGSNFTGTNVFSISNNAGETTIGSAWGTNSTFASLNVAQGIGTATTWRDIDLRGSWSGGEGHAITASHGSSASNMVGQMVFQHDAPGSRIKWGRLYHSGDQSTYPMELVSNSSTAYLRVDRDLYISGGGSGNYGNRLIVGNTDTSYTLQDTNLRPTIQAHGAYPVLSLNHTVTSNTQHGPTIQFTSNGTGHQFVIGTNGTGTMLSMGYSNSATWNPHNGISGYEGTSFFHAGTNGYIGIGSEGDWTVSGGSGTHTPGYNLHFIGSNVPGHSAYFDNRGSTNGSGFLFRNLNGNHSWGIVAEIRIEGSAGTDRPSLLFSTGYNTDTWSVGFGSTDSNFRIKYDHGHRNGGWGTTAVEVDRSSNMWAYGSMRSPIFYNHSNTGYYVDGDSTSVLYYLSLQGGNATAQGQATSVALKIAGYQNYESLELGIEDSYQGVIRSYGNDIRYYAGHWKTTGNTATEDHSHYWYTSKNGSTNWSSAKMRLNHDATLSVTGDMRAPIFYDSDNTGYYIDPNNNANIAGNVYIGGWFRNYGYTGLYNESYGNHWYATGNDYWNLAGNNGTNVGIIFRTGGHQGASRGFVYADSSNNIGFLNSSGSWRLRVVDGDYILADGSSMRAQIFYDSNDTDWYVDANNISRLKHIDHFSNYGYFRGANRATNDWVYGGLSTNPTVNDYSDGSWYVQSNASNWDRGLLSHARYRRVEGLTFEYEVYITSGSYAMIGFTGGDSTSYNYGQTPANLTYHYNAGLTTYTNGSDTGSDYSFNHQDAWWKYKIVLMGRGARHYVYRNGEWNLIKSVSTNDQNSYEWVRILVSFYTGSINWRDVKVYVDNNHYRGLEYRSNFAGIVRAATDVRAPIFYDSANTAYLFDGAATGTSINVAGSIIAAGNVTAYSDIRLKSNIKPIENAINKVRQINGVTYDRKENNKRHTGVIAQDVLRVLPEAVEGSEEGMYSVAYGNMVGLLIEAIKEQQSEIDELKALVKQLLAK